MWAIRVSAAIFLREYQSGVDIIENYINRDPLAVIPAQAGIQQDKKGILF